MEALPPRLEGNQPLQHVLSLNTARKNRFLLHFNSLHALTQWTAAIRLTIYENTLLQESYTGALIAGKGKSLNSIRSILAKTTFKYEDWTRVRFGPGNTWQRCWCVVSPPNEKAMAKYYKSLRSKKSAYNRPILPKGDIKFYETKRTKRVTPIATISDAYSVYAIYPLTQELVEQSTLVKVEGQITIHSEKQPSSEGFVFVLPELHAAISGFEMMVRWLFPVFDTFGLYGRPTRLNADTSSTNSLMFALSSNKRNGYLEVLDVSNLILTEGSKNWSEQEWRKQLKDATTRRLATLGNSRDSSISGPGRRSTKRESLPARYGNAVRFGNTAGGPNPESQLQNESSRSGDAHDTQRSPQSHTRAASDNIVTSYGNKHEPASFDPTMREDGTERSPPSPPPHGIPQFDGACDDYPSDDRSGSDGSVRINRQEIVDGLLPSPPPDGVAPPPPFSHDTREMPQVRPHRASVLARAGNRMSSGTLTQLMEINQARGMNGVENPSSEAHQVPPSEHQESSGNVAGAVATQQRYSEDRVDASSSVYSPISPASTRDNRSVQNPSPTRHSFATQPHQSPTNLPNLNTHPTVIRKPVNRQERYPESPTDTASSLGSLRNTIDVDALNMIITRERTPSPLPPHPHPQQNNTYEESTYDVSSVASPDYASSRQSSVSKRSVASIPKPRMGRMKVVGSSEPQVNEVVIGDAHYQHQNPTTSTANKPEIPLVDFGPTHTYMPTTRRPSTSDTLTLLTHNRNPSEATLGQGDNNKRPSLGKINATMMAENQPAQHSAQEKRRSVLWQPGMVPNAHENDGSNLTAEQFVQQRAASGNRVVTPTPAHYQTTSRNSPSPRPASGDWTTYVRPQPGNHDLPPRPHSRGASVMLGHDPPSRPHSRGASVMLGQSDISSHLSAREQEHVARVTGSSFFNLNGQATKSQPSLLGSGLVSAIDARERERKAMKEGRSGHMVQQAIAQRQYQNQYQVQQYQGQYQGQHLQQSPMTQYAPSISPSQYLSSPTPNGNYGNAGYFPPQQQWAAVQDRGYYRG